MPWARPDSGFTLLFEAFAIQLIMSMSVKEAARLLDEKENRLWRALNYYVEKEIEQQDFEKEPIINLAIDEVSMRKGHIYVTNFLDIDTKKVIYVAPGKGSNTLTLFKKAYLEKGGKANDIQTVVMDMSPAFISGVQKEFPKARIVFDKFHVMKVLNEQLDSIRRREQKAFSGFFNKTRYLFLKAGKNLTPKQKARLEELLTDESKDTVKAYNLIQVFKELFDYSRPSAAGRFLTEWIQLCKASKIPEMKAAAKTIFNHIEGILQHIRTKRTNAMLEGFNSKLRVITKRAYGFKCFHYLRTMIFLTLGKLHFSFETTF